MNKQDFDKELGPIVEIFKFNGYKENVILKLSTKQPYNFIGTCMTS